MNVASSLWTATSVFLSVAVWRCVCTGLCQLRIWLCWAKLPHTKAPWSITGDLSAHRSFTRHLIYKEWNRSFGGGPLGVRLAFTPVRLMYTAANLQLHSGQAWEQEIVLGRRS